MQGLEENKKYLRHEPTAQETKLWAYLRSRRCDGHKFRHQVPIGRYIVDFFCLELGLIIEVDGDMHAMREKYDEQRTAFLNTLGYHVIRFGNNDVMQNIDGVIDTILINARKNTNAR